MVKRKLKGLLLFSGGLDSLLAFKISQKLGIDLTLLIFKSYFFDEKLALKAISLSMIKAPYRVIDISQEQFQIVKNPLYGYGKNLNPCLDCHLLMLKKAKEIKEKEGFDLVITGEVLGERPFSQNISALKLLEEKAGLKGCLLRPLSALLLEPTIFEKEGLINRSHLLDISGRSRKRQLEIAKKFRLKWFPTPSGGCLLTDPQFSNRLKQLLGLTEDIKDSDIELLKLGRHFVFDKLKIIIGRNQEENQKLKEMREKKDLIIEMKNYPGPTALIRSYEKRKIPEEIINKAKEMIIHYSKKTQGKKDIEFIFY
ncbi:MAG: tRNA 4-thiouridine(8) synthase ThiI [Minisyncoccia bacterium]